MNFRAELERLNLDPKSLTFVSELYEQAIASIQNQCDQTVAETTTKFASEAAALEQAKAENAALEVQNQKLKFEVAHLRRLRFGAKTEAYSAEQKSLFEDDLGEDIAAGIKKARCRGDTGLRRFSPNTAKRHERRIWVESSVSFWKRAD